MKCREHGLAPVPPHERVTAAGYALAVPVGFTLSAGGGMLALYIPFLLGVLLAAPLAGGLIGEAMSYCTHWKRGARLAAVGAATVGLGSASAPFLLLLAHGGLILHAETWQAAVALEPLPLLFGVLAAAAAYWRIR